MKTESAGPDHVCHGNTALLLAAPALLTFYRASQKYQMTVGHPEATVQDELNAEAAFDSASIAAAEAVRNLTKQEKTP